LLFSGRYCITVSMRTSLNPSDRLTLSFIALLATVILINYSLIPSWPWLIGKYSALVLAILLLAALDERTPGRRLFRFLHAFIPIISIIVIFNSLGDIIPYVRQRYYDDVLIRIDYLLFTAHPTVWMERFQNALLTAVLQVAYVSYYFMPIALGAALFLRNKQGEFGTAVFTIILCFYLSYIGYLLFPAVGPRFTLTHLQTTDLQAGPMTLWIQRNLNALEHNKTDAFPSGHTAVALVSLFLAWKYRQRKLFRVLVPAVSALIVSTVYLRYHYVIDVIAGVLLAVLTIVISPWMYRFFSGVEHSPQR
jgi:membrane-associated phospholipid phosphatase